MDSMSVHEAHPSCHAVYMPEIQLHETDFGCSSCLVGSKRLGLWVKTVREITT